MENGKSAYNDGQRDAQISALFNAVEEIKNALTTDREDTRRAIDEAIAPVRKAVLGNGDPRKGIAAQVLLHGKILAVAGTIYTAVLTAVSVATVMTLLGLK